MLGISIKPLREAFRHLFLENSFDAFYISEARLLNEFTAVIDGKKTENAAEGYVRWERLRPLLYPFIKGEKAPERIHLVFLLPEEKTAELLSRASLPYDTESPPQLFMNLRYQPGSLLLTTGVSDRDFRTGSDLYRLWDKSVLQFINRLGLSEETS